MCGIAGWLGSTEPASVAGSMAARLTARGPDDSGVWCDDAAAVALAHRRLSILDLSAAGHQPMHSVCGRYVVVFNGEIYNHLALRENLRAIDGVDTPWRGHSDTETLLRALAAWGVERTLKAAVGMFALALWDRDERTLTLARDRFGEKPLFYGFACGRSSGPAAALSGRGPLLFASELKALAAHPAWQGTLATETLESYLRYGCVGGANSIFRGVAKLPPGSWLTLTAAQIQTGQLPSPLRWWTAEQAARVAMAEPALASPDEAVRAVEHALGDSVRARMLADVPLGAFLSGGIDSSLIVALMQQRAGRPVKTFSVGFDDSRYDESIHAAAVARHLGTEHRTLRGTAQMALDWVPRLPEIFDEPFADSSQIPTAVVASLTRQHVTVALSGDAGDELFGGYNRHLWVPRIWRQLRWMPFPARRALATSLTAIAPHRYDALMRHAGRLLPRRARLRTFGEKLHKLAAVLESPSEAALFAEVASMNRTPAALLAGKEKAAPPVDRFAALPQFDRVEWMLLMDTLHFLVDDVLVKVDRASMASSLEVRVPFLDPAVFHTAWRIPVALRLNEQQGKWVLRQLLDRHVPRALIERPKMGFAVPLDAWLRGPLREWAEGLFAHSSLATLPMLEARAVRALWQSHLKGQGHHAQQLWAVLQLLAWQARWRAAS